nr:MAG TPA: Neuromedin U [Caudoviricetes sp.]
MSTRKLTLIIRERPHLAIQVRPYFLFRLKLYSGHS